MANTFNFKGGLMTYLGKHGAVRTAALGIALVGAVSSAASRLSSAEISKSMSSDVAPYALIQAVGAFNTDAAVFSRM